VLLCPDLVKVLHTLWGQRYRVQTQWQGVDNISDVRCKLMGGVGRVLLCPDLFKVLHTLWTHRYRVPTTSRTLVAS
jgi:hypothetical protein